MLSCIPKRKYHVTRKYQILFLVLFVFFSQQGFARVFDFNKENIFTYFHANAGLSAVGTTLFSDSAGSGVEYSDQGALYNQGAGFGFGLVIKKAILSAGVEVVQPRLLPEINGLSGGTLMYSVASSALAVAPVFALEMAMFQTPSFRSYVHLGGGLSAVVASNSYVFSSDGTTAYGLSDFKEELKGSAYMGRLGVGMESHFVDSSSVKLELGYRNYTFHSLRYTTDHVGFNGAQTKDGTVLNSDGSKRKLSLSGFYLNFGFAFYIDVR